MSLPLIFVRTLKRVLSISEVKTLYDACVDRGVNVASTYDMLVANARGDTRPSLCR